MAEDAPTTPAGQQDELEDLLQRAVDAGDAPAITALLEPLPLSDALRELLYLAAEDRDAVLSLLPAELAAELVEEAPNAVATDLVERLPAARAAEIIDELDSDVQADLIGELE